MGILKQLRSWWWKVNDHCHHCGGRNLRAWNDYDKGMFSPWHYGVLCNDCGLVSIRGQHGRKLRQFRVTESLGDGIEVDSVFTIEGYYESTRWETILRRITYPFRKIWWQLLPARFYFSNLWAAICGRRDDY